MANNWKRQATSLTFGWILLHIHSQGKIIQCAADEHNIIIVFLHPLKQSSSMFQIFSMTLFLPISSPPLPEGQSQLMLKTSDGEHRDVFRVAPCGLFQLQLIYLEGPLPSAYLQVLVAILSQ